MDAASCGDSAVKVLRRYLRHASPGTLTGSAGADTDPGARIRSGCTFCRRVRSVSAEACVRARPYAHLSLPSKTRPRREATPPTGLRSLSILKGKTRRFRSFGKTTNQRRGGRAFHQNRRAAATAAPTGERFSTVSADLSVKRNKLSFAAQTLTCCHGNFQTPSFSGGVSDGCADKFAR